MHTANLARDERIELLGELHPLLEQLGSTEGLFTLSGVSASLQLDQVTSRPSLTRFLEAYQARVLLPVDLPAIRDAHRHACRNETRELIGLDQELAARPLLGGFAPASCRMGQAWVKRFRPLRDQRVVQRYLRAVEAGTAHGWHTIVYGITLAIYSLPLRQGLLSYARQTLRGYVYAAARPLRLSERDCRELVEEVSAQLPDTLARFLARDSCLQAVV